MGEIEPWIRELPPAARGRMLAVRRTAEWERSGKDAVRFLGVNCLRLIDEVLALPELPADARQTIGDGRVLLDGIDELGGTPRAVRLEALAFWLADLEPPAAPVAEAPAAEAPVAEAPAAEVPRSLQAEEGAPVEERRRREPRDGDGEGRRRREPREGDGEGRRRREPREGEEAEGRRRREPREGEEAEGRRRREPRGGEEAEGRRREPREGEESEGRHREPREGEESEGRRRREPREGEAEGRRRREPRERRPRDGEEVGEAERVEGDRPEGERSDSGRRDSRGRGRRDSEGEGRERRGRRDDRRDDRRDADRRDADRRDDRRDAERREVPEAVEVRPVEPEVRKLPLGHPEGTGVAIATLGGLSPDAVERLADEGVLTVADLLLLPPTTHERPPHVAIGPELAAGPAMIRARLRTRCLRLTPHGRRWEAVLVGPDEATLTCRWVSEAPRGWERWHTQAELALIGTLVETDDGFVLYEGEPVGLDGRGSGLTPQYGVEGVEDRVLRASMVQALTQSLGALKDGLPAPMVERHRLLPLDEALRDAHFPANTNGRGRTRLAFEELFLLQVGIAWRAGKGSQERGIAHTISHAAVGQLGIQHSVALNDGQEAAFAEIRRDLLRPRPMTRLLQGDVGAGKGIVAFLTGVLVASNGHQVAFVAPDSLAAERRFLHAETLLRAVGLTPLYVPDNPNHAAADAIRRGEAHVVFGTRRIIEEGVAWKRLGLVVVEERGPYGTVSPAQLAGKGAQPDLLVVTRAPIPSTLAFTVFGDFDVSVVPTDERPRASQAVVPAAQQAEAYAKAREEIAAGRQVFVVFPVRDGKDLLSHDDALRFAKALQVEALPGARIGVYCSSMSAKDRHQVFDDFQHRRMDVLVCTTYIEDAPVVANANTLIIHYADLCDMVRLHRLRGHVGMGHHAGHVFFVLSDRPSEAGTQALDLVMGERDGFRLAEVDLTVRGPEALLGDRAGEMPELRWADPPRDRELLLRARADAFALLVEDPGLRRSVEIAKAVTTRWGDWLGSSSAPAEGKPGRSSSAAAAAADKNARRGRRRRRRR